MQNALLVAFKPPFTSSSSYLGYIKRKYRAQKAGFSGTLDPFAKGVLTVGFGAYTKLFDYLDIEPKRYRAVLWLGVKSASLDTFHIESITPTRRLVEQEIISAINDMLGDFTYSPPIYSAKWVDGTRAYKLARQNVEVELKSVTSTIYDIKFINYNHPFLTIDVEISKGGYIRSIAEYLGKQLKIDITLSSLTRLREGKFAYNDEIFLNPLEHLSIKRREFSGTKDEIINGIKIAPSSFDDRSEGAFYIDMKDFFSILEIRDGKVKYLLNKVPLC